MREVICESLENRRLLAAAVAVNLSGGVLDIEGTPADDNIKLVAGTGTITVDWGTGTRQFQTADVHSIIAIGLGGNDRLDFSVATVGVDLAGGDGNDTLLGGSSKDAIQGNAGNDVIFGHASGDLLGGGLGADTIQGGRGLDVISGGKGNDSLDGGVGNDSISGGDGADTLLGGEGNDLLAGDGGANLVRGQTGDDRIRVISKLTVDSVFGGDGGDTVLSTTPLTGIAVLSGVEHTVIA